MIGHLRGLLIYKQPPELIIEVNGVGYELEASLITFQHLPKVGEEVALYTHWQVREDGQFLFGFSNRRERMLFRELIKVSGIGAKLALLLLSGMSPEQLAVCVRDGDVKRLVQLPGIGKKTAERLIIEMRDRLGSFSPLTQPEPGAAVEVPTAVPSPIDDAVSALVALGYKSADAAKMVERVDTQGLNSEAIIRAALRQTVR